MIMRVLWPRTGCGSQPPQPPQPHLLLGALLHGSLQHDTQVLVAVVVALHPLAGGQPSQADSIREQLSGVSVRVPQTERSAALGVLGVWLPPGQDADAPPPPAAVAGSSSSTWLCLRGALAAPRFGWRRQQGAQTPALDLQHSRLPPEVQSVQVFSYAVPAQQPGYAGVQLPRPQQGPQVPWMARDPAAVSLAALMHMLQQAHGAIAVSKQQQQLAVAPGGGWQHLAATLVAASDATRQYRPWCRQRWAAQLCVAAAGAAGRLQLLRRPGPDSSRCGLAADGSSDVACSASGARLQWAVQHLLGVLIGLNLFLQQQVLLEGAAAAAAWLQEGVLEPHIQWLTQAHPAGVKLHLELSLLLGASAQLALQAASALYRWSWPLLGPAVLAAQAAAAAVGGASWGCAAAADLLQLLLAPLVVVYVVCAAAHRLHLRCLAATWRLMRGRQKVRRFSERRRMQQQQQQNEQAASSSSRGGGSAAAATPASGNGSSGPGGGDEVSVEQLIVGVLLFTPLLGLLPTTTAWYVSVCWLYGVLHGARLLLVGLGSWMQLRPLHVLAARWSQPQLFPGQLMVRPLKAGGVGGGGGSNAGPRQPLTAPGERGGAGSSSSSSSLRRRPRAEQQPQQQQPDCASSAGALAVSVSHFSLFYEPLPYGDVLSQSVKQQQGLLWWLVCQGGQKPLGASLLAWLRAVSLGRTWGLRCLSTHWW